MDVRWLTIPCNLHGRPDPSANRYRKSVPARPARASSKTARLDRARSRATAVSRVAPRSLYRPRRRSNERHTRSKIGDGHAETQEPAAGCVHDGRTRAHDQRAQEQSARLFQRLPAARFLAESDRPKMIVLVLFCHLESWDCTLPETALIFVNKADCQKMADEFNADPDNKAAGAEERCLITYNAP
jgi:hypothetical protein